MEIGHKVAGLIDDRKGLDIRALDVRGISPITDYLVLASAETVKQTKALADHLMKELKLQNALVCRHLDGYDNREWIILAYFDFLIPLFKPQKTDLYDLDHLYGGVDVISRHD